MPLRRMQVYAAAAICHFNAVLCWGCALPGFPMYVYGRNVTQCEDVAAANVAVYLSGPLSFPGRDSHKIIAISKWLPWGATSWSSMLGHR